MKARDNKRSSYTPGVAQLNFKPTHDWSIKDARQMYNQRSHVIPVDKIIYDDCMQGMDEMPDECVDLIIADPPFGIKFNGKGSQYNRKGELVISGYREVDTDYDKFSFTWISRLPRIMKESSSAYIFSGWTNLHDILYAIKKSGLTIINHIIWKYQFGVFTKKKFVTSHYHVLFVVKNPKKYFFNKIEHYPLDVWEIPRKYIPGQLKNGTKLPEDVVCRCINFSSKPGDLIFDPFMGNGTTAISAKMTFRHYYGFEINAKMKSVIESNLQKVQLGERYKPYSLNKPALEDLVKKYPAVQKFIKQKERKEKSLFSSEFVG
ncbi:MAG: DNA-methyltransferase [Promethearchaeota archaeon]